MEVMQTKILGWATLRHYIKNTLPQGSIPPIQQLIDHFCKDIANLNDYVFHEIPCTTSCALAAVSGPKDTLNYRWVADVTLHTVTFLLIWIASFQCDEAITIFYKEMLH